MSHDTLNVFQQHRLTRHLPVLLGLSLLPLHLTLFITSSNLLLMLWGNHLLLAGLWALFSDPRRQSLLILAIIAGGAVILGLSWSLPLVQTGWLLTLAALITGRALTNRQTPLIYLLPAFFLLCLTATLHYYGANGAPASAPMWMILALNTLGGLALLITLMPLPEAPTRVVPELSESACIALVLCFFLVCAALLAQVDFSTAESLLSDDLLKLLAATGILFTLITVLVWTGKPPDNPSGYSEQFRDWMTQSLETLSTINNEQNFVSDAITRLADTLELDDIEWQVGPSTGQLGTPAGAAMGATSTEGFLRTSAPPGAPAALQHQLQLALDFVSVLTRFRLQEQQLKTQNHLESIYETGARITHDVKNLLQALNTLTTAVEHSKPDQAGAIQSLIRKQLPLIRQKLQVTLEKLEAPEDVSSTFQVARIWWEKLHLRYEAQQIEFHLDLNMDHLIPRDLFERVAENLLENALRKRQSEPAITVSIELIATNERITLRVTDSGSPAPAEIVETLFKGPIDSTSGYGIALYQCAMQAVKQGFELNLTHNEPGQVSFCLSGEIG